MLGLSLVTAPTVEPVLPADLMAHARIDYVESDLAGYIAAARKWCETYTRRQFITATWRLTLDYFPCGCIEPPIAQLLTVSSITYIDTAGTSQAWSSSSYNVDVYSLPGRIEPVYGEVYPSTREQNNAVTVTFTAGYGAAASNVPDTVKTAIKLMAAHLYENREATSEMQLHNVPLGVKDLLSCERWGSYV